MISDLLILCQFEGDKKLFSVSDIYFLRLWRSVIEKPKFWSWATLRLDSGNYPEVLQSLQSDQSRFRKMEKIRVSLNQQQDDNNNWVLSIVQDLVKAVLDDNYQLKSIIIVGSGASSVKWASLSPELLAQLLVTFLAHLHCEYT